MQKYNKEQADPERSRNSSDKGPAITPKCPDVTSSGRSGTFTEHGLDKLQSMTRLLPLRPRGRLIQPKELGVVQNKEGGNLATHQSSYLGSLLVLESTYHSFTGLWRWSRDSMYTRIRTYIYVHICLREQIYVTLHHKNLQVLNIKQDLRLFLVKTATTWWQRRELVHCCFLP